jgi:nicotinamide mononucleotide transporter
MELNTFLSGFFGAGAIEVIASLAGFLCVYLVIKRNIWCWPVWLLQVSLYIVVFYEVRLYSDALLHLIYVFMQIYGWWNWAVSKRNFGDIRIVGINRIDLLTWAAVSIIFSFCLGWIMATRTDAALPYLDAFTTITSLVAQWLLSRRYLASWLFWIAVDIVAINIYWQKSLFPTALLYSVFLIMAVYGLVIWLNEYRGNVKAQELSTIGD